MSEISKELIENYRKIVLPYISNKLYKANFEGQGKTDKTEFEQDFNEILDLAISALERPQGGRIKKQYLVIPKDGGDLIEVKADNFIVNAGTNVVYFDDIEKKRYVAAFPLSGICGFKEVNGEIG